MASRTLPDEFRDELISAARTAVGDEIRSITYFTEADVEQLYLRNDLESGANLERFADNERLGLRSQFEYEGTELGDYEFTMRAFEEGYLTRVTVDDAGVFVTTDPMARDRFEELASAVRRILRDFVAERGPT